MGGISFLPFYKFLLSNFPTLCLPPPAPFLPPRSSLSHTSRPLFSHLPFWLCAPSDMTMSKLLYTLSGCLLDIDVLGFKPVKHVGKSGTGYIQRKTGKRRNQLRFCPSFYASYTLTLHFKTLY